MGPDDWFRLCIAVGSLALSLYLVRVNRRTARRIDRFEERYGLNAARRREEGR